MTPVWFVAWPVLMFSSAAMLMLPHLSPRQYFFAVTVPAGFARTETGRSISRLYHWGIVAAALLSALLMLLLGGIWPESVPPAAFVLPFAGGATLFLAARARALRYADSSGNSIREADLSPVDDRLPRWFAFALAAFVFPMAAALYLRAHWDQLPARIPVHFGLNGQPDRWVDRTANGVFGLLAVDTGFVLLLLLLGVAVYYGARRLPQRTIILKMIVAAASYVSLEMAASSVEPLLGFSILWILIPTPLLVALLVIWAYTFVRNPRVPVEVTPDTCWHLGVFYANPRDPAVFVQKRLGFGYTINWGNRLSWLFLAAFAATFGLLIGVLH